MCMTICYVHYFCQLTPQLQNYLSPWTITYQEDLIGCFVLVCARTSGCGDWTAFRSDNTDQGGRFWMWVYTLCHPWGNAGEPKKTSPELNSVLQDVIEVINHIKVHALNSRLFEQLCEEMDAEHRRLLLYTEMRWLSRGTSLARVFELWESLQSFLLEK